MTVIPYDFQDSSKFYEEYYSRQVGDGLAVYSGRRIMDGDGLGSFLGGMLKKAAPMLKGLAASAAKSVGKHALNTMSEVMDGGDFRTSALRGLKNVGGDMVSNVFQEVSGRKRKAKKPRRGGGRKKMREGISLD
jgi:hypothetical protein